MIDFFATTRHRFAGSQLSLLDDVMTSLMWTRVSYLPTALWAVEECIPSACEALPHTRGRIDPLYLFFVEHRNEKLDLLQQGGLIRCSKRHEAFAGLVPLAHELIVALLELIITDNLPSR